MLRIFSNQFCLALVLCLIAFQVIAKKFVPTTSIKPKACIYNPHLGSQYFNQGDYLQAKVCFEQILRQAKKQGKLRPSIYYNLGSVYFKLAQFDKSKASFKQLLKDKKLGAVAYYNLALIANKQGNKQSVINYLKTGRRVSGDKQLTALINRQLLKLQGHALKRNRLNTVRDWRAYLYVSPGYDSNIYSAPIEAASNKSGNFIQIIGLFEKVIAGKGMGNKQPVLLFTSSVFLSNYFATNFNDYDLYDLGMRYLHPINHWKNVIEFNVKQSSYGHSEYQRFFTGTFKTKYRLTGGNTLRLRYRYEEIESLDLRFDYLEGNRQKLTASYQFKWLPDSVYLWYELEFNNRKDTLSRNYSPTRNTIRVRYEKKINITNEVFTEVEYRRGVYDPTPTQNRLDNRMTYTLAYVRNMAGNWQFMARWRLQKNRSSDSFYSYDRHIGLLTLRKSF